MSRNSIEKSHAGITRRRFIRLGSGLLMAAAGAALLPEGSSYAQEDSPKSNPSRGIPYWANNSLGIHREIVEAAMQNARYEQQADRIISESYHTPDGTLRDGITTYRERKWDHLHFFDGLPVDPAKIETLTSFASTPETVGWKLRIAGDKINLTHLYNPNGTPWLQRNEYLTSLQLQDPTLPLTITRVYSSGGGIDALQVISGNFPPFRLTAPSPRDHLEIA